MIKTVPDDRILNFSVLDFGITVLLHCKTPHCINLPQDKQGKHFHSLSLDKVLQEFVTGVS